MPNDQLMSYVTDCRKRGLSNVQIIDELVKAGWAEDNARMSVSAITVDRKDVKKRKNLYWIIPLLAIVLAAAGFGAWSILRQEDTPGTTFKIINQPTNQVVSAAIADCEGLSEEKQFITLETLQKDIDFTKVKDGTAPNSLLGLSQEYINILLKAVQPYIRPVTGFAYEHAGVTFYNRSKDNNTLEVYIRASTGKKDLDKYFLEYASSGREQTEDFFYDFKSDAFDDHSFIVQFNRSNGTLGTVTPGYFVGWDVPDIVTSCSLGLLEENEAFKTFKEKYNNSKFGLLGWKMADPSKGLAEDSITGMIHSAISAEPGCSDYQSATFNINPWQRTVILDHEGKQTICID